MQIEVRLGEARVSKGGEEEMEAQELSGDVEVLGGSGRALLGIMKTMTCSGSDTKNSRSGTATKPP